MNLLVNVALFQIGWFACVLGAAHGRAGLGSMIALTIVVLHCLRAPHSLPEAALVLTAAAMGALWDSILGALGWFDYGTLFAPYWIVALWMVFATTLNVSLRWLKGRYLLGALFGAVGGPIAYYAGEKLGAFTYADPLLALGAQAVGWALLMPLMLRVAQRLDGFGAARKVELCSS
ncbi:MAG: DUF2878 domain-containing protein [Gammaproteobacteria bacterium]